MKTQMEVKTDGRSLYDGRDRAEWTAQGAGRRKRRSVPAGAGRWVLCALLIGILAISGFSGADNREERRVSASPVVSRTVFSDSEAESTTYEDAVKRLEAQREKEIVILDSVLADDSADQGIKKQALEQKVEIVNRLETQAGIEAALAHMGFHRAAAICADERVMLILPPDAADESEMLQVIDAVCSVSGCQAKDVKIILAKK